MQQLQDLLLRKFKAEKRPGRAGSVMRHQLRGLPMEQARAAIWEEKGEKEILI